MGFLAISRPHSSSDALHFCAIRGGDVVREIKFRFWNPYLKNMSNPYTLHELQASMIAAQCFDHAMQYTGLKDKNGVEIYEGDLITSEDRIKEVEVVEFESGYFQISGWLFEPEHFEVIGNIYENPELLEVRA